ncbi:hypothetical protein GQ53DRAFT_773466 [Thozetella sp. PMI_491]|nr:hypothetical protein GQ53DRAFT_773466 [Thozetella sp. PMI_491]
MASQPTPRFAVVQTRCLNDFSQVYPHFPHQDCLVGEQGSPLANLPAQHHHDASPPTLDENNALLPARAGCHDNQTIQLFAPSPAFSTTSPAGSLSSPNSVFSNPSTPSTQLHVHPCLPLHSVSHRSIGTRALPARQQPIKGAEETGTALRNEGKDREDNGKDREYKGKNHENKRTGNRNRHHHKPTPSSAVNKPPNHEKTKSGAGPRRSGDLLARNRVAATKSRAKIQAAMKQLATHEQDTRNHHNGLVAEEKRLRDQVYVLKNELLAHAGCCPLIRRYLAISAAQISGTAVEAVQGSESKKIISAAAMVLEGHQEQCPV